MHEMIENRTRAIIILVGSVAISLNSLISTQLLNEAVAQSTNREDFIVQTSGNIATDCSFLALSTLNNQLARGGLIVRPRSHSLVFSVWNGATLNAAAIDNRLAAASTLIQANTTNADSACCASILRNGAVTNFAQPASMTGGVIANAADLNGINVLPGDVKVVAAINFCGQAGNFGGCQTGNSIVLTTNFAAAVLAHEVGHREGLCHVGTNCTPTCGQAGTCAGCADPSSPNIMWFANCAGQGDFTNAQCQTFQGNATQ